MKSTRELLAHNLYPVHEHIHLNWTVEEFIDDAQFVYDNPNFTEYTNPMSNKRLSTDRKELSRRFCHKNEPNTVQWNHVRVYGDDVVCNYFWATVFTNEIPRQTPCRKTNTSGMMLKPTHNAIRTHLNPT